MAKQGKRGRRNRKFRRYLKGAIDHVVELTTLAALTLVGEDETNTVSERTYVSSVNISWALANLTPATGVGPFRVGVAHSDYTDAEIEAWLENTGWNEGNLTQQEVAARKIRSVGIFDNPDGVNETSVLNEGRPIHTKCGWVLTTGQTIKYWVFNMGSGAVATTVPVVQVQGHANLWPQ